MKSDAMKGAVGELISGRCGDVDALNDIVKKAGEVVIHESLIPTELNSKPASVASVPEGRKLVSLEPFHAEQAAQPRRHTGTTSVDDVQSFIALVNRYCYNGHTGRLDETPGDPSKFKPRATVHAAVKKDSLTGPISFTAVFDGHTATDPGFGDFRTEYNVLFDEAWLAWLAVNNKALSQVDFANFIEERIVDISPIIDEPNSRVFHYAQLLRGSGEAVRIGTPMSLMDASRGISLNITEKVQQAVTLSSGEVILSYATKHDGQEGVALAIPTLFGIRIPIVLNGEAYEVAARLRCQSVQGNIVWTIKLIRPDLVLRQAVAGMMSQIADDTLLPVVAGVAPVAQPFQYKTAVSQ